MTDKLQRPEIIEFIKGHLHDDPFSLSLKAKNLKLDNPQEAILQIQARQKALKKLPAFAENFSLIFPNPVSVEQSSSEITARFKAGLMKGQTIADLTGGMGIDSFYFAQQFEKCIYVERDEKLCNLTRHNFKVLDQKNIEVLNVEAERFISETDQHFDWIYLDPSRRDGSQKVFRIRDCQPDVIALEEKLLEKADHVLVKLSPLADIKNAFSAFKYLKKVWIVAVKNECKELLCLLSKKEIEESEIEAVNIEQENKPEVFSFDMAEETSSSMGLGFPLDFIYEPNAAILKSGAFKMVGNKYGLMKLHASTHLYTSEEQIDFPGRIFKLKAILKPEKKRITGEFKNIAVNVITRNFHWKAEEVFRRFNLKKGDQQYLIATTLKDNSRVLLSCDRIK